VQDGVPTLPNGFSVDEVKLAIGTFNGLLGRDTPEAVLERHQMPAVPPA
jgi:hypothetical protein